MDLYISRFFGFLATALISLSFLYTPNSGPLTSGFLEFLAAAGWGAAAIWIWTLAKRGEPASEPVAPAWWWLQAIFLLPAFYMGIDSALRPYEYPMLSLAALLCILAASITAHAGYLLGRRVLAGEPHALNALQALVLAVVVAALLNAMIGIAQYLQLPLPTWLGSQLTIMGRSYGNLRQPNQYAQLLCWGVLGLAAWAQFRAQQGAVGPRRWAVYVAAGTLLAFGTAVSGSRAGGVYLWVIAAAGLVAPGLQRGVRLLLVAIPALHAAAWWGLVALDLAEVLPFYSTLRTYGSGADFNSGDISNSRFAIWRDTWALVQQMPLTGHGFYRLNKELLTNDTVHSNLLNLVNAHNIFLQWAFEFGIPAVVVWTGAAIGWMARVWRVGMRPPGLWLGLALALPAAHNLIEHSLWFVHFLLPCAFAAGIVTAMSARQQLTPEVALREQHQRRVAALLPFAGAAMILISAHMWVDHGRVEPIYLKTRTPPLAHRLEAAYSTVWFRQFVDQAVVGSLPLKGRIHCDLSKKVLNFYLGQWAALNAAVSCASVGEMDLARKLVAAVERGEPQTVQPYSEGLSEQDRALFDQLRTPAGSKASKP